MVLQRQSSWKEGNQGACSVSNHSCNSSVKPGEHQHHHTITPSSTNTTSTDLFHYDHKKQEINKLIAIKLLPMFTAIYCDQVKCSFHAEQRHQQVTDNSAATKQINWGSMSTGEPATVVHMDDGKSSYATAPAYAAAGTSSAAPRKIGGEGLPLLLRSGADGFRRCLAVIDFVLRVAAFGPTLAAAISTGTADERLSVFTNFFQFHARFDDFPAFTFFMVANAVAAGYLVLSLPFSAVGILRPNAAGVRLFLLVCDMLVMLLLTGAGAAAAAILYVAHWGNLRANWVPICMQFHGFCQRTSGAVVASFLAVLVFLVLILMGAGAIRRR